MAEKVSQNTKIFVIGMVFLLLCWAISGMGLMAVTPAKQRRMSHAALAFLVEREWMTRPVRFDVVEITAQGILYVPNAFMASR